MASTIKTNNITGFSGGAGSAPITLSGDTATLSGTGVTFPSGVIVQGQQTTHTFSGDTTGVDGTEVNQAFGGIFTLVPKYNNTKILFMMELPEIYAQHNYWGMGFCVTTNSGLTAGQGNNDPEGSHGATVYVDYKQRNVPSSPSSFTSVTLKTISCSAGTTLYIAPIITNYTGSGGTSSASSDIFANLSGPHGKMTQTIMEMVP